MDAGQIGFLMALVGIALLITATSNHQRRMKKQKPQQSLTNQKGYTITWHNSK